MNAEIHNILSGAFWLYAGDLGYFTHAVFSLEPFGTK